MLIDWLLLSFLWMIPPQVKFCMPAYIYGPSETPMIVPCPLVDSPERKLTAI